MTIAASDPWLTRATLRDGADDDFPFDVPAVRGLDVELDAPVTLLAGANGSGKSTILEALAFLNLVADMVRRGGQFVIATHSPMVLAIPRASILSRDRAPLAKVAYDELDSVQLWRDFLAAPGRFLRHVWEAES